MKLTKPIQSLFWPIFTLDILAIIIALIIQYYTLVNSFKEGGFLTYVSTTQLVLIFLITYLISKYSVKAVGGFSLKSPSAIWMIISTGFLFLAADEVFAIHEQMDVLIHDFLNIKPTGITDRLDDLIVAVYGLIGIGILIAYRQELKTYIKKTSPFVWGFILFGIMVILDVLTNRLDALLFFFERETALVVVTIFFYTEDSLKLVAEVCFMEGFYLALLKIKESGSNSAITSI